MLIVSIVVTFLSAILENKADSRLQKIAEEKGNQAVVNALRTQHETYVEDLKDQVEERLLPKIDEGTRKLELAAGKVSSAVTGRNGYVYFEVPEPG